MGRALVFRQDAPQALVQRVVVMDARDALHRLAIAQGQAAPVHMLQHAQVGLAVPRDFNVFLAWQLARH
jgi:hypothetical protein